MHEDNVVKMKAFKQLGNNTAYDLLCITNIWRKNCLMLYNKFL